jgi:hypothetical protein
MKICPHCSFNNDECFPTCVWCNTALHEVVSTPAVDPAHPEHERKLIDAQRRQLTSAQIWFAGVFYTLAIVLLAVIPGLVFSPLVLLLYAASSVLVFVVLLRHGSGQFLASFLQGTLSATLVICFGPQQPLIFFMLAAHVIIPSMIWHWVDLIHGLNR